MMQTLYPEFMSHKSIVQDHAPCYQDILLKNV